MKVVIGIAILLVGIIAGIAIAGLTPVGMVVYEGKQELGPEDLALIPYLDLEGFSEAAVDVGENQVYLFSGCRRLTMVISDHQAISIGRGLAGELDPRPNSHDTFKSVMDTFGMEPIMVKVTHLEDGTYYARLFLLQGTRVLNLDTRPSDAIAIAVRTGTPIYVNQTLVEEQGEKVC